MSASIALDILERIVCYALGTLFPLLGKLDLFDYKVVYPNALFELCPIHVWTKEKRVMLLLPNFTRATTIEARHYM